jgi:glucokinase
MGDDKKNRYVGFDLGGTKMLAVVFDGKFNILGQARKKTKGAEGADAGMDRIVATIEEALTEAKVDRDELGGIGMGIPGPLDLDEGVLLESPNLGWHDLPLQAGLEKKFKCHVALANDVDAGTFGEYKFGAGRKGRCVLGVFPGTGIGGACIYEGRIIRGSRFSCMEIGHMHMQTNGRLCGCGRRGCLETIASRLAIAAEAAMAAYRGEAPWLLKEAGTDLKDIRSSVLADSIKAGDTAVEKIVRNAAMHIGIAVANAVNLLAPDIVVLGGGLVEAMPKLFIEEVEDTVKKRAMITLVKSVRIVEAELGDNAGVMGAAALAAERNERG